jgi:hypothetical protein
MEESSEQGGCLLLGRAWGQWLLMHQQPVLGFLKKQQIQKKQQVLPWP